MNLIFFKIIVLLNIDRIGGVENYRDQFKNNCGQPKIIGKIVGGTDAAKGEFPWFTRIGERLPLGQYPNILCAGSLITDQHVLTVKHCFRKRVLQELVKRLVVSLGDHNENGEEACDANHCSDRPVIYEIAKIIPYNLNESRYKNDIALVILATKVEFTRWISPICLPDNISPNTLIGETVITIGFGLVNILTETKATILQKITITMLPNKDCVNLFNNSYVAHSFPGQLCAGSPNKTTCYEDSGGPLFKLMNHPSFNGPKYVQLGIVSFGHPKCEHLSPAVYTDVNYYLKWIDNHLNNYILSAKTTNVST